MPSRTIRKHKSLIHQTPTCAHSNNVYMCVLKRDLRKGRTLSPDATIMANNGSRGEMVASAINITHQMLIHISLPRHFPVSLYQITLLNNFSNNFCCLVIPICNNNQSMYKYVISTQVSDFCNAEYVCMYVCMYCLGYEVKNKNEYSNIEIYRCSERMEEEGFILLVLRSTSS